MMVIIDVPARHAIERILNESLRNDDFFIFKL
jgi:hypothetical protein